MNKSEEEQFFEKVYYKCNIEPLLEQIYQKTHLQEMANSKVKDSITILYTNIGNAIKGWFPEKALGTLRKFTGEDKNRCVPQDNNGNPIDKTSWVIQIITGLIPKVILKKPLRELRDLFPKFFSGLRADRLQKELPLDDQEDSPPHSQGS